MLGRLVVSAQGTFTINYDLMNGESLRFNEGRVRQSPYIPEPFPRMPERLGPRAQPEVRMRAPTLWAALNLAARRTGGTRPTVLISIAQKIDVFTESCLAILDRWAGRELPEYFEAEPNDQVLADCLASMADYFSEESFEYRLLSVGIAVHHGKLPAPVGRRLKRLIDRGSVRVIIATSTLSEGVNIPVNYILIPNVFRGQTRLDVQEFANLVGRAGRPGVATEGHALVLLPDDQGFNRQRDGYQALRNEIEQATIAVGQPRDAGDSSLVALLRSIESTWRLLTGSRTQTAFYRWLEETAVIGAPDDAAIRNLDTLDYFLLCALSEVERLRNITLENADMEAELARIWRSTYAHAAAVEEERLSGIWIARGRAIPRQYPDAADRARIYKTSLTPRSANILLRQVPIVVEKLQEGAEYGRWPVERRFAFVSEVVSLLDQVPSFRLSTVLGSNRDFTDWPRLLRWWLCKNTLEEQPTPKQITVWFDYVSKNFSYRSAWGLGGLIAVVLNQDGGEPISPLELDDWPRAGLPWIAFWLKELFTWGTLEPVAAFLLARGDAKTRPEAEQRALEYYDSTPPGTDANEVLDPRAVREWAQTNRVGDGPVRRDMGFEQQVTLTRAANVYRNREMYVTPILTNDRWTWVDKAGHPVATSAIVEDMRFRSAQYEFTLVVDERRVTGRLYLPHRDGLA